MSSSRISTLLVCLVTLTGAQACRSPAAPPAAPEMPSAPPPVSSAERALPVTSIDLAHCFAVASQKATPDEARCPAFISEAIMGGMQTCSEVGGQLIPQLAPTVWALDVNGDRKMEYLFELGGNVGCDGAPSIFSCGSLGCPVALYERRNGAWRIIGSVSEGAPDSLEILPGGGKSGYRNFRTGCIDPGPCAEYAYYEWTGQVYEVPRLLVRDVWVDVTGPDHGLANIPSGTPVLATPTPDGEVLDRYKDGAEVEILGQSADYFYVSPCRACQSGFVPKSVVRRE